MLESVLAGAVAGGTSILYPTLGEVVAERSGVINLGTEGSMLCGALAAYAVGIETGSPWLGVLAGLVAGALLAAVHAFVVLARGANQLATGLVVTFLGIGLTALFGQDYVGQGVQALDDWDIPLLSDIPFFGRVLFEHDPLTYLSILVAVGAWWALRRTRGGHPPAGGRRAARGAARPSAPRRCGCGPWPSSSAARWPAWAAPSWPRRSPATGRRG